MAYLLDADTLIEARKNWYGMDFCPAYWDWLSEANSAGSVFSVERVAEEIFQGNDELVTWAQQRGKPFFLEPDDAVVASLTELSVWVTANYDASGASDFLSKADSYLVAHAHAHEHIVVTREVQAPSRKKVKIPNVCIAMGVQHRNPFEMLRSENVRFVLGEG